MATHPLNIAAVGPQRTASTWLYAALLEHPQLAFPEGVKETFFFDDRYEQGWSWYDWHFRHASSDALRAEVAPTYFHSSIACERLKKTCPDLRIIIAVRDPVERAISLFRHHRSRGRVSADFQTACEQIPAILSSGDYAEHAPRWEQAFGEQNVHYVVQEDVAKQPQLVLDEVCRFLQIESISWSDSAANRVNQSTAPKYPTVARWVSSSATLLRKNRLHWLNNLGKRLGLKRIYSGGGAPVAVDELSKEMLARRYEPHISWLEQRLQRRFDHWHQSTTAVVEDE